MYTALMGSVLTIQGPICKIFLSEVSYHNCSVMLFSKISVVGLGPNRLQCEAPDNCGYIHVFETFPGSVVIND
jgi:hypothetical protein